MDYQGPVEQLHTLVENDQLQESQVRNPDEVTLSTGVVLRRKPVSKLLLKSVVDRFKKEEPKVPQAFNEAKGRMEDNPGDPDYIEAKNRYEEDTITALIDLALVKGSELVYVPDGIPRPEDDEWLEEDRLLNFEVPEHPKLIYLHWIKSVAAPLDEDIQTIFLHFIGSFGVPEAEVEKSMNRFPGETEQPGDLET